MRPTALLLSLLLCAAVIPRVQAQDVPGPGERQDAEDAREKLLKAADQLDNIQANSEATKNSVDAMKNDVATLQQTVTELKTENASLRQQLAQLQNALDEYKDEQLKSRQKLIDDVAGMIAAANVAKPTRHKHDDGGTTTTDKPDSTSTAANLAPPADAPPAAGAGTHAETSDETPAKPKAQKGYYHVVAAGETLSMIVDAYRDKGVETTVAAVRKANGMSADQGVKAGQKIFIPKPGT